MKYKSVTNHGVNGKDVNTAKKWDDAHKLTAVQRASTVLCKDISKAAIRERELQDRRYPDEKDGVSGTQAHNRG